MIMHKCKRQGRSDVERYETRRKLKLVVNSIPSNYSSLEQIYSSVSNLLKRQRVFTHVASGWKKIT